MRKYLTSKSIFTHFFMVAIPFIMFGNKIILSIGGLNFYLSLLVNCIFIFFFSFFYLSRNKQLNLVVHKSSLCLFLLLVYFVLLNLLHENIASFSYIIIFSIFILLTILFFNAIDSYNAIFLSIIIGTILTIIKVVCEVGADLFNISVSTRYDLGFIGGINNFAYIVTLSIIIAYYKINSFTIKSFVILLLTIFNLMTLSRGANLILFFFFLAVFLKKENIKYLFRLGLIFVVALVYIFYIISIKNNIDFDFLLRYDIFSDLGESSSNRTIVWSYALSKISTIRGMLWGFGSATYQQTVGNKVLTSLHNQYLDFIYSFGFIFSIPFFYVLLMYYWKCIKLYYINPFIFWINTVYIISFFFDTRIWVVQTIWIYPLVISFSLRNFYQLKLNRRNIRI